MVEDDLKTTIAIDFYRIDRKDYQLNIQEISLFEILNKLLEFDNHLARKWELNNFTLEIPYMEKLNDESIQGMCIKYRKSDLPLTRDEKTKLPKNTELNEIGEGVAFLFIPQLNVLLLERDYKILSPSRFMTYMSKFAEYKKFNQVHKPILKHYTYQEIKEQFNRIQRFSIRGAFARNAKFLKDSNVAVKAVNQLVEDYGDVIYELTMSTRSKKKNIGDKIWDFLGVALEPESRESLANLEITGLSDKEVLNDEYETEAACLNLINNKLSYKITYVSNNTHYDYNERKRILNDAWAKHKKEVENYFKE